MWFELAAFIVHNGIVSFGKSIVSVFMPAVDQRAGGKLSAFGHAIFAIVTLESPRLMLISRYRAARMKNGTKVGLSAVGGTAVAAIIISTVLVGSQLIAVSVDGKVIGYVESEEQYASLVQKAKDRISEQVGTETSEILIQDTNVSLETVLAPQQQAMTTAPAPAPVPTPEDAPAQGPDESEAAPLDAFEPPIDSESPPDQEDDPAAGQDEDSDNDADEDQDTDQDADLDEDPVTEEDGEEALLESLIETLLDGSAVKATVYTITINDEEMATLSTMKEASEVLNTIADSYTPAIGDCTGKFADDVVINSVTAELDDINVQDPEDVVAYLLAGTTEERSYTAGEEDSVENICAMLGITEDDLKKLYAEYDFEEIQEGDAFDAVFVIPFIHYETEGLEISNEPVDFKTVEEKSNELFLGQRKTSQEGELGERMVTRFVTRINGEIVDQTETGSEIIKEAVDEVIQVGTQIVFMGDDAYVGPSDGWGGGGGGPLGRPLNSWYLSRSVGGGHAGADMLAPRGTPIFAAESGVVSFTGVYGGYGNLVIIDHGNGLQTYYAHCDTINTVAGAAVGRGQQIATVGSTGRSTAFHLHFEVRVNGAVQEPMNWIN